MKRSSRQLGWQWVLVGALLIIGRFTVVWAGNVSPSIEDTGTNVGIGTTGPVSKLDIQENNSSVGNATGIRLYQAGAGDVAVSFRTTAVEWGIGLDASDSSKFKISSFSGTGDFGSIGITINTSGNVGIGTTAPGSKLDVKGQIRSTNGTAATPSFTSSGENNAGLFFGDDGVGSYLGFSAASSEGMRLTRTGNVGIGTTSPATKLHVVGDVQVDGNLAAKYQDVAEWVQTPKPLPPGMVVVVSLQEINQVLPASQSYDTRVAGVVSAKPGLLLGEAGEGKVKVAQSGRVKVKVDAGYGPIAVGDLLVTSATPGHAMRSTPVDLGGTFLHRPGTLLGKALESLKEGRGEILVLLTLQ